MFFEDGELKGTPKGLKKILEERGKYFAGMKLDCKKEAKERLQFYCAYHTIAQESDFVEQIISNNDLMKLLIFSKQQLSNMFSKSM